jgi:AraC-like DNA-binding protein
VSSLLLPATLALPIRPGEGIETADVDEIVEVVTRTIAPHRISVTDRGRNFKARQTLLRIGDLGLMQIGYNTSVAVRANDCGPSFLVKMPVSGGARIRAGNATVETGPDRGAVFGPDTPLAFDYSADCAHLVLRLDSARLERQCAALLGEAGLQRALSFDLGIALDRPAGQNWLRLMRYMLDELNAGPGSMLASTPLALASLDQMVMTTLLSMQPNSYSALLLCPASPALPFYVKRAEAYIEAHLDEPVSILKLAAAAGVSARSLQTGFQQFRGTTPMAHLRALRLKRAHDELLAADPRRASVTDIAMRWGFSHLGKFAVAYKERFGESPRDTLGR